MRHNLAHLSTLALMDEYGVDSLFEIYRIYYKYTDCGPTIGFLVRYTIENDNGESGPGGTSDEEVEKWIYCDDLRDPLVGTPYRLTREFFEESDTWPDLPVEILGISVGSIVEGVDRCADTIYLEGEEFTRTAFSQAVDDVNNQVDEIWKETHGCEGCAELAGFVGTWGETVEGCDGATTVHPDCEQCGGNGVPI